MRTAAISCPRIDDLSSVGDGCIYWLSAWRFGGRRALARRLHSSPHTWRGWRDANARLLLAPDDQRPSACGGERHGRMGWCAHASWPCSARPRPARARSASRSRRYDGEIINCDSTAVYRGFDIGTDKVPAHEQRRGIPHHLIDIADPTEVYTAAQFARDAARASARSTRAGGCRFSSGGTGFYYRALTRGLFPGPGATTLLRARLERVADRRGVERLHACLRASIRRRRRGSCRATGSGSCARSRSTSRPAGR